MTNRRNESRKRDASLPKKQPTGSNGTNGQGHARAGSRGRVNGSSGPIEKQIPVVPPKTTLATSELEVFRGLLLRIRRQLLGDVDHMENEALQSNRSDASGDLSLMPIHMADIGTDNYEREFTIGLIENETETLREIDAALERIEKGTYGVCEGTHKPIGKARLKVMPWARYCVAYERSKESGEGNPPRTPPRRR